MVPCGGGGVGGGELSLQVMVVVNRDTLAWQIAEAFERSNQLKGRVAMLCGCASPSDFETSSVVVATIQSLCSRYLSLKPSTKRGEELVEALAAPAASLVIIDECHGAHADSYDKLAAAYPRAPCV